MSPKVCEYLMKVISRQMSARTTGLGAEDGRQQEKNLLAMEQYISHFTMWVGYIHAYME